MYSLACINAHKLLDELYESVHTPDGDPLVTPEEIKSVRQKYLAKIRHELDLIQSASEEASEV
jgi:1-acyl-sn-glycerol-3-phosphate acyltransferase